MGKLDCTLVVIECTSSMSNCIMYIILNWNLMINNENVIINVKVSSSLE